MKKWRLIVCVVVSVIVLPFLVRAQSLSNGGAMQTILDQLYGEMMPMCKGLITSSMLIGGFGALWYIGMRVGRSLLAAETVDVYGLLRPFAIGFCILIFPSVIALINGILHPTVTATAAMEREANAAFQKFFIEQESQNISMGMLNPANWIRAAIKDILELVYYAITLLIDVIRTFYLIVLAIIGPIVFALSIYDGFQHLITVWLARYINVYLWLPVANIFGAIVSKIQENMIKGGAYSVPIPGQGFSTTDWAYLAFLLIAIAGYCCVPSVCNYIINAGGGNSLLYKVSSFTFSAAKKTVSTVMSGMSADVFGNGASKISNSMSSNGVSNDYFKDKLKS